MKTYIKIEIEKDYNNNLSYDLRNEGLSYLLSELSIYCEIANSNFINIVEDFNHTTTYKEDYKNTIQIEATGYSQNEWQTYSLFYNKEDIKTKEKKEYFKQLLTLLERSFTHQNDYQVTKKEIIVNNGKEYESIIDYTNFAITNIEFPDEDDIIRDYTSQYGKDYDKYNIDIN
jgi:hypothetical protein